MYRPFSPRARDRFRARRPFFFRPSLEALEDRITPTGTGWAIDSDPNAGYVNSWGLALDGSNNSIQSGYFSGTTIFGPTTLTSAGDDDGYLAKYDANGSFLWAKSFGGSAAERVYKVAADANGNIYVAGFFASTAATFGNLTETNNTGHQAAFIAKLDPSGNFQWVTPFYSTTGDDSAFGVAVDDSGNVYATGSFTGTTTFGSTILESTGGASGQNAFVTKLDAATGTPQWATSMGSSTGSNWAFGVTVDPNENVYVTGRFSGTASFGSTTLTSKSTGGTNPYVAQLDSSGNFQWAQRMGGEGNTINQAGYDIAVDARSSDPSTWAVYVTGIANGNSCDFGSTTFSTYGTDSPGSGTRDDAFVTKLNAATGSFQWADQLGGPGQEMSSAITLDGSGNIYTTGTFGSFNQPADFDPHGTFTMYPGDGISAPASGSSGNPTQSKFVDAYVSMLDPSGNFLAAWQTTAQAQVGYGSTGNSGAGVVADSAGDIWACGNFNVVTTFPTGQTLTPAPAGTNQLYLFRLNAQHGALVGTVYADLDQNGTRDNEPALSGWTVYADLNNNGVLDSGEPSAVTDIHGRYEINGLAPGTYTVRPVLPSGWTTSAPSAGAYTVTVGNGFAQNDIGVYTPTTQSTYTQSKATTIKGRTTVQSTLSISDSYSLLDVDLKVSLSYSPDSNLYMYLIAPDGTNVPLVINNGGSGANFTNTIFDDEASTSITTGAAPFSGSYQPLWPLAALQNKSVKGTWTLEVVNSSIITGKINSWSLTATHTKNGNPLTASPLTRISQQSTAVAAAPGGAGAAVQPAAPPTATPATAAQWTAADVVAQQLAWLEQMWQAMADVSLRLILDQMSMDQQLFSLGAAVNDWGWILDVTHTKQA